MAYFAKGMEFEYYQEKHCARCANWRDGDCAVMWAHWDFVAKASGDAKAILDELIPMDGEGPLASPQPCSMFRALNEPAGFAPAPCERLCTN